MAKGTERLFQCPIFFVADVIFFKVLFIIYAVTAETLFFY